MKVIASDSKEFKRPKLKRDESGELIKDKKGNVIIEDVGFFTPLGVTVYIKESKKFLESFRNIWIEKKKAYNVELDRRFCGAQYVVRKIFPNNFPKALSFLYDILEGVEEHIDRIHFNWVIIPKDRTPMVKVGGNKSIEKPINTNIFKRTLANVFPCLNAWSYQRHYSVDFDICYLDLFQGKTNNAWIELTDIDSELVVVPHGDEVNPFICIADISAYLMDKKLYAEKLQLFRDNVMKAFKQYSFEISSYYYDERNIGNIKWRDEKTLVTSHYYPSPMVWMLIDNVYMESNGNIPDSGDSMKIKEFITRRGFMNLPLLLAQRLNGGMKTYHPDDKFCIRDGDYLIYMGQESKRTAETIKYAIDVTTMDIRELRKKLKK